MGTVVLAGATSGSTTLSPTDAVTTVITLPSSTDTLVGKATTDTLTNKTLTSPTITGATITVASTAAPAFSAYQSTLQAVSASTFTKVQCQTEEFDTNSNYDNATNYRFTPTVAGYYQVNGAIGLASAATGITLASIYKNGSEFKRGNLIPNSALGIQPAVSALINLNGSTDYVELWVFQSYSASLNSVNANFNTYFQAAMIRSA